MGGLLSVGALAVGLLVTAGPATRPLGLSAPQRQAKELTGVVYVSGVGTTLTRLDENLNAYGPRLRVGFADAWAVAPEGRIAAISTHASETGTSQDSIRFVALGSLRLVPRPVALHGAAWTLFWTSPDRLLTVVRDCCGATDETSIAVVDAGARRIVSRVALHGDALAATRAGDRLVVLVTPTNALGPARLAIADARGVVRTVGLDRIVAGRSWPQDHNAAMLGTQRVPALAADGEHVYVIQPDGPAAEISLDTLHVSYHELGPASLSARLSAWLQPSADAKGMNGTAWRGLMLGNGFVAVSGGEEHAVIEANTQRMWNTPAGLVVVDVRDWTIRTIDRGADDVQAAGGLLLATGRTWSSNEQRSSGMGLAAYGTDTTLRYHLFQGDSAWVQQTWNGRAYVVVDGKTSVVELATGRVLEQRPNTTPWLLTG